MSWPKTLRLVFNLHHCPVQFSPPTSIATLPCSLQRRTFSITTHRQNDFFNYTSGRWIYNETARLEERRRVFNVDGLRQLAAGSVNRSPDDILDLKKLNEDGFNRTLLITMHDGFQMVAGIPLPVAAPPSLTLASEAATLDLLHSQGLPVPKVYGYSPTPDNAAETEYIFTEFMPGTLLKNIWDDLNEDDIASITRQLTMIEKKMMSLTFPAGGSLYYAKDLQELTGSPAVALMNKDFCVGPDLLLQMWYGRRAQLAINRGPYKIAEDALVMGAKKEKAYLERFGQPLLPFDRTERETYSYEKQKPGDYIENLDRYLSIAPSLIPSNGTLGHRFCIRHPSIHGANVIVDRTSKRIVGLINWQKTRILPLFLQASIPECLDACDNSFDPTSRPVPTIIEDIQPVDPWHNRRLGHYYYVKNTRECNELLHTALVQPMASLRNRLFAYAGYPWQGDILRLKLVLIEAMENWGELTEGNSPCPIAFSAKDIRKARKWNEKNEKVEKLLTLAQNMYSIGLDGWVSTEDYENAMEMVKGAKEIVSTDPELEKDRSKTLEHWVWDDMDEKEYL